MADFSRRQDDVKVLTSAPPRLASLGPLERKGLDDENDAIGSIKTEIITGVNRTLCNSVPLTNGRECCESGAVRLPVR